MHSESSRDDMGASPVQVDIGRVFGGPLGNATDSASSAAADSHTITPTTTGGKAAGPFLPGSGAAGATSPTLHGSAEALGERLLHATRASPSASHSPSSDKPVSIDSEPTAAATVRHTDPMDTLSVALHTVNDAATSNALQNPPKAAGHDTAAAAGAHKVLATSSPTTAGETETEAAAEVAHLIERRRKKRPPSLFAPAPPVGQPSPPTTQSASATVQHGPGEEEVIVLPRSVAAATAAASAGANRDQSAVAPPAEGPDANSAGVTDRTAAEAAAPLPGMPPGTTRSHASPSGATLQKAAWQRRDSTSSSAPLIAPLSGASSEAASPSSVPGPHTSGPTTASSSTLSQHPPNAAANTAAARGSSSPLRKTGSPATRFSSSLRSASSAAGGGAVHFSSNTNHSMTPLAMGVMGSAPPTPAGRQGGGPTFFSVGLHTGGSSSDALAEGQHRSPAVAGSGAASFASCGSHGFGTSQSPRMLQKQSFATPRIESGGTGAGPSTRPELVPPPPPPPPLRPAPSDTTSAPNSSPTVADFSSVGAGAPATTISGAEAVTATPSVYSSPAPGAAAPVVPALPTSTTVRRRKVAPPMFMNPTPAPAASPAALSEASPRAPSSSAPASASGAPLPSQPQSQPLPRGSTANKHKDQKKKEKKAELARRRKKQAVHVRLSHDGKALVAGVFRVSKDGCLTVRNVLLLNSRRVDDVDDGDMGSPAAGAVGNFEACGTAAATDAEAVGSVPTHLHVGELPSGLDAVRSDSSMPTVSPSNAGGRGGSAAGPLLRPRVPRTPLGGSSHYEAHSGGGQGFVSGSLGAYGQEARMLTPQTSSSHNPLMGGGGGAGGDGPSSQGYASHAPSHTSMAAGGYLPPPQLGSIGFGNNSFTLQSSSINTPYSPITYSMDNFPTSATLGTPRRPAGRLLRAVQDEAMPPHHSSSITHGALSTTADFAGSTGHALAHAASFTHTNTTSASAMHARNGSFGAGGAQGQAPPSRSAVAARQQSVLATRLTKAHAYLESPLRALPPGGGAGGGQAMSSVSQQTQILSASGDADMSSQPSPTSPHRPSDSRRSSAATAQAGGARDAAAALMSQPPPSLLMPYQDIPLQKRTAAVLPPGLGGGEGSLMSPEMAPTGQGGGSGGTGLNPYRLCLPQRAMGGRHATDPALDPLCAPELASPRMPSNAVRYTDLDIKVPCGEGASASVFVAIHLPTGRRLAVKRVDLSPLCLSARRHTGERGRFLQFSTGNGRAKQLEHIVFRELQVLHLTYRSPFMVKVYNAFYLEEIAALDIVMEFMHYGSLDTVMAALEKHAREKVERQMLQRRFLWSANTSTGDMGTPPTAAIPNHSLAAMGNSPTGMSARPIGAVPPALLPPRSAKSSPTSRTPKFAAANVPPLLGAKSSPVLPSQPGGPTPDAPTVTGPQSKQAAAITTATTTTTTTTTTNTTNRFAYPNYSIGTALGSSTTPSAAQSPISMLNNNSDFPYYGYPGVGTLAPLLHGGNTASLTTSTLKDASVRSNAGTDEDVIGSPTSGLVDGAVSGSTEEVIGVAERVVAVIGEQLLRGVRDMHGRGYIHRDIKPGNVLINEHGVVKLSDFGLSQRCDKRTGVGIRSHAQMGIAAPSVAPTRTNTPLSTPLPGTFGGSTSTGELDILGSSTVDGGGVATAATGSPRGAPAHSLPRNASDYLSPNSTFNEARVVAHLLPSMPNGSSTVNEDGLDILDAESTSSSSSSTSSAGSTGKQRQRKVPAHASSIAAPQAFSYGAEPLPLGPQGRGRPPNAFSSGEPSDSSDTSSSSSSEEDEDVRCSGTDKYMSPERQRGEPHGKPSDVWAVGVTLAEFALGFYPYDLQGCTDDFERAARMARPVDILHYQKQWEEKEARERARHQQQQEPPGEGGEDAARVSSPTDPSARGSLPTVGGTQRDREGDHEEEHVTEPSDYGYVSLGRRRLRPLSTVFADFIRLATLPVASERPTAQELLEHPFFRQWSDTFNLKEYLGKRVLVPSNAYKEEYYKRKREKAQLAREQQQQHMSQIAQQQQQLQSQPQQQQQQQQQSHQYRGTSGSLSSPLTTFHGGSSYQTQHPPPQHMLQRPTTLLRAVARREESEDEHGEENY